VVFKHLPLTSIHPHSLAAAVAATCAHEQGLFWNYYRQLFTTQDLSTNGLTSAANALHLNVSTFSSCVSTEKFKKHIEEDVADAVAIGIRGTPTFIVNGEKIEGAISIEEWNKILLEKLKNSSSSTNQ
jgi:protein-disulfide isomerase